MQGTATFKQVRKIRDEHFIEENIQQYTLLLNIGTRDLQLAVTGSDNRILFLEDYIFPSVSSLKELIESLDSLFDNHPFAKAGFWKAIKVAVKNQKMVQVPLDLFEASASEQYLKLNARFNKQTEEIRYVEMSDCQAVTIFSIPVDLKKWLEKIYPKKQFTFTHQSAALIESILEVASKRADSPLYLYIDRFRIHLLFVKEDKLVYYNQFTINNFEEYVKYIMLVMNTLGMKQDTSKVLLWGYIGNNSPHYHEFVKYIRNVEFGPRPQFLRFGYPFDEVQEHTYLDVFGISLV